MARPRWLIEKLRRPRTPAPRTDGKASCQSFQVSGHWRGYGCGNDALYRVVRGEESENCCYAHVTQALARLPGGRVEPIEQQKTEQQKTEQQKPGELPEPYDDHFADGLGDETDYRNA